MTTERDTVTATATGERFIPELMGGELIDAEHQARYRMAAPHVAGLRVLDAGCGVGWGSKLLFDAGATEVTGLDLDQSAVADARTRVAECSFTVGDLMDLPFDASTFDVVVCFEALEHTQDTDRTLDELTRVLKPSGLLFVSSPNPEVYPAGNPFHIHEMRPDELLASTSSRFQNNQLYRQHLMLGSLVCQDGDAAAPYEQFAVTTRSVVPVIPGHDPYSVVAASDGPLPDVSAVLMLAPSAQLDDLAALGTALTEEREAIHDDHQRIVRERRHLLTSLESAQTDARQLRELLATKDREAAAATESAATQRAHLDQAQNDHERVAREAVAAVAATAAQRAHLERAQNDRDRFAADLVASEQELARMTLAAAQTRAELLSAREEIRELRWSTSWRITGPLRRLSTTIQNLKGRPPK